MIFRSIFAILMSFCLLLVSPLISIQTYAAIKACFLTKIGPNAPADFTMPAACSGDINGDAKQLAQQVLNNPKITLSAQARQDIQATIDGKQIQNADSCNNPVSLSPALLKLMLQIAQNHSYDLNYIVTQHGCDTAFHPKGRAMDIGKADGQSSWQNTQFRQDVANLLPAGGGLGQQGCPVSVGVTGKNSIRQFADSCNHQHVDVGADAQ